MRYIKLGTCMHEICMSCSGHRMYKDCCNLLFEHSLEGEIFRVSALVDHMLYAVRAWTEHAFLRVTA